MKNLLLLLLLLCLGKVELMATDNPVWKEASANGYTYRYVENDPQKVRFYTLKNGLKVMLSVNKKEPRIRALLAVRAGSNTDPSTHTGLAHYLEHLLFKGTDKFGVLDWAKEKPLLDQIDALYEKYNKTTDEAQRSEIYKEIDRVSGEASKFAIANEYDKMMKAMGGKNTNAHTWYEETVYEEDVPSNALDRFLKLQADRFRNPVLRIFHTELEAVYEEKNRSLDNDDRKVYFTGMEALFPSTNYGLQTTIGTVEHLKNPSLVEIRNYYQKYYVPNNMAIILVGDFNPDEVIKKVDEQFAYMQPKPLELYNPAPEKPISQIVTREVWGPTPERVVIHFRTPGQTDARGAMLANLCDAILANASAGLIDLNLNKQQKVLNAGSTIYPHKDYSASILIGLPKQGQSLDEVKEMLLEQVEKLKKGEFDENLIRAIAANNKLQELQGGDNNYVVSNNLSTSFIYTQGDNWGDMVLQNNNMAKVSKKEVMDFAKQYFGTNNYVVLYKRQGEDKSIQKVPKPSITAVETNNKLSSPYLDEVNKMPMQPIQPKWLDFKTAFKQDKIKSAEFYYVPNVKNDIFRLSYYFEMGNWNNKLLSLAAQYLSFVSTDKMNAEQISKEFYGLACSYGIGVDSEVMQVQITGLQENFGKAVALFEQIMANAKPDEAAWVALRNRLLKARMDAKGSRGAIRQAMQQYAQYGAKNPFNHVLSDAELNEIKAEDLTKVLKDLFKHQHRVLYFGPSTQTAIKAEIQKLHPLPAVFAATPAKTDYKKIAQTKPLVLFTPYEMVQAEINWVLNKGIYDVQKSSLINVFNQYFGAGSFTSIIPQTIRESKALAYSTSAFYAPPAKKGEYYTLSAYLGTQADKMNESIKAMNELLNDLPQVDGFVQGAKLAVKNNFETGRIQDDEVLSQYFIAKRRGLDFDDRKLIYEGVDKLTFADLKKFHQETIAKQPHTLCVVASDKKINVDDLKQYGELKTLSLQDLFGY
jgi:predicted Zn-dependent peptidase